ncbi:TetR/AcrR family transcriptional regulator [Streptomyces sp. NPDC058525]|uniref:TetR/AcrR family transcriptional regulator n=1 Tax=Streptomyces sp. NPDC058525 TaxID=3346538 RepID=UPI003649B70A
MPPERVGEVYGAVMDLLLEVGYESLTMDAVAARARSSKTTLYRQWNGKPELVASALRHAGPVPTADVDTGSLRGDLLALTARPRDDVERDAAIVRAMTQAAANNPDLDRALHELIFEPALYAFEAALDRALRRGEVDPNTPAVALLPHMLVGAATARPRVEHQPPDAAYMTRYIDAVVLPALRLT